MAGEAGFVEVGVGEVCFGVAGDGDGDLLALPCPLQAVAFGVVEQDAALVGACVVGAEGKRGRGGDAVGGDADQRGDVAARDEDGAGFDVDIVDVQRGGWRRAVRGIGIERTRDEAAALELESEAQIGRASCRERVFVGV